MRRSSEWHVLFPPRAAERERGRKASGDLLCTSVVSFPPLSPSPYSSLVLHESSREAPISSSLGEAGWGFDAYTEAGRHVAGATEPHIRSEACVVALSLFDQKRLGLSHFTQPPPPPVKISARAIQSLKLKINGCDACHE